MKDTQEVLTNLIGMNNVQFVIPVYQRNYSWQKKECQQLLDDLIKLMKSDDVNKKHFLGSMVLSGGTIGSKTNYIVVDGQQRLTTVFILLVAMFNILKERDGVQNQDSLYHQIWQQYLVNHFEKDIDRKKRLRPLESDRKQYNSLFESDNDLDEKESNITRNYHFFRNQILVDEINIDDLFNMLGRLELICINLDDKDDPQRIFESLNSTGVALEESDKIRNYILMGMSIEDQEEYYKKYWLEIERRLKANEQSQMEEFMRHYLVLHFKDNIMNREIYFRFREYAETVGDNKKLLEELYDYAKLYETILKPDDRLSFKNNLVRLNQLGFTVIYPYLLVLLDKFKKGILSGEEVKEILQTIESYLFRRIIVGLPSHGYSRFFAGMEDSVKKKQNRKEGNYVDIVKSLFLLTGKGRRFPNDNEFLENLMSRNIYEELLPAYRKYLFSCLENGDSKEQTNVIARLENKQYTIEHIMPQTLNSQWIDALGENYEEIHETWLHTLPNLTLTGYNSKYNNRSFEEKLTMKDGFRDSPLRLNKYIGRCETWTEKELRERKLILEKFATELWKHPVTSYKEQYEETIFCSIEDVRNFKKREKLYSFVLFGKEQINSVWKSMFVDVFETLREYDPIRFQALLQKEKPEWIYPEQKYKGCEKIEEGNYYLYVPLNTLEMMSGIQYLLHEYGLDDSDITFNIRRLDDTDTEE